MRCDRSITTLPTLTHWAAFSAKRGGATIQMPSFGPIGTPLLWKHRLRAQRPANGPSELDSERGTARTALPHQRLAAVLWTYPIHWVCRRPNLDRFVILKSRDNLTALSCVRRLRVELLEVEKKDLDLVEVLDGPDGLERRLHDRRNILTEAEAQPGATAETITAALLDELRKIRSSGPSASLPSMGDNAPTPLDESRLVAVLTGSDNAAFRKITMALSGLDLSTPSGQRDALTLGYDGQCVVTVQVARRQCDLEPRAHRCAARQDPPGQRRNRRRPGQRRTLPRLPLALWAARASSRAVNLQSRNIMFGLYRPHGPTGASKFGPTGWVTCDPYTFLSRWVCMRADPDGKLWPRHGESNPDSQRACSLGEPSWRATPAKVGRDFSLVQS